MDVLASTMLINSKSGRVFWWDLDQNGNPVGSQHSSDFNDQDNATTSPGYTFIFRASGSGFYIYRATRGTLPNGDQGWVIDTTFNPRPVCSGPQSRIKISD